MACCVELLANFRDVPQNMVQAIVDANRWSDDLADVADKVYTRDLFRRD